ncbi:hypothetical protein TruAng_011062 [Truncatella angustata]|nr:hypothetical protein TruAng_011062 [Truncatella angustata]
MSHPSTPIRSGWNCGVIIIGAGMSGLGAAIALAGRGGVTSVLVFEADDELNKTGRGLQLSPNCIRILDSWGVANELASYATELDSINFCRYATGQIIGQTDIQKEMLEQYGYPY